MGNGGSENETGIPYRNCLKDFFGERVDSVYRFLREENLGREKRFVPWNEIKENVCLEDDKLRNVVDYLNHFEVVSEDVETRDIPDYSQKNYALREDSRAICRKIIEKQFMDDLLYRGFNFRFGLANSS